MFFRLFIVALTSLYLVQAVPSSATSDTDGEAESSEEAETTSTDTPRVYVAPRRAGRPVKFLKMKGDFLLDIAIHKEQAMILRSRPTRSGQKLYQMLVGCPFDEIWGESVNVPLLSKNKNSLLEVLVAIAEDLALRAKNYRTVYFSSRTLRDPDTLEGHMTFIRKLRSFTEKYCSGLVQLLDVVRRAPVLKSDVPSKKKIFSAKGLTPIKIDTSIQRVQSEIRKEMAKSKANQNQKVLGQLHHALIYLRGLQKRRGPKKKEKRGRVALTDQGKSEEKNVLPIEAKVLVAEMKVATSEEKLDWSREVLLSVAEQFKGLVRPYTAKLALMRKAHFLKVMHGVKARDSKLFPWLSIDSRAQREGFNQLYNFCNFQDSGDFEMSWFKDDIESILGVINRLVKSQKEQTLALSDRILGVSDLMSLRAIHKEVKLFKDFAATCNERLAKVVKDIKKYAIDNSIPLKTRSLPDLFTLLIRETDDTEKASAEHLETQFTLLDSFLEKECETAEKKKAEEEAKREAEAAIEKKKSSPKNKRASKRRLTKRKSS